MSRTLYWYDDGDDGSSESWGESPEAYLRRKWLESHNYLVPATRDGLDEQDYTVLLSLCEEAMLDEPYTNRAVYLCRLIDKLEVWMLAQ